MNILKKMAKLSCKKKMRVPAVSGSIRSGIFADPFSSTIPLRLEITFIEIS